MLDLTVADEWIHMTLKEWGELGVRLHGPDANQWKVVCPSCGLVQTRQDWLDLGMGGRMVDQHFAFHCIGRWKNPIEADEAFPLEPSGNGCLYKGDSIPNIAPYQVIFGQGDERPTFGFQGHDRSR